MPHACMVTRVQAARCRAGRAAAGLPDIKVICLDVDGTLLNGDQQLTARVKGALESAATAGIRVRD